MFERLSIETSSYCHRRCATCLRQTHDNRDALEPWFSQNLMPTELVYDLLDQAAKLGFAGTVCLSYYNEPTLDDRLGEFGSRAKQLGFSRVVAATTGDTLNESMAAKLDGCFDMFQVSLYENNNGKRREEICKLFSKTRIRFTNGLHINLHPSVPNVAVLETLRCLNVSRNLVVNHRGEFLSCCQEITPHFNLGTVHDTSLEDLWKAKEPLIRKLRRRGERTKHPYCAKCSHSAAKDYTEVVSK